MPLKATSSDLNRVSKKEHHQEEGGLAQDVNAQAQVSIKVEGLTVKQRVGSDEKKTGRWIDPWPIFSSVATPTLYQSFLKGKNCQGKLPSGKI